MPNKMEVKWLGDTGNALTYADLGIGEHFVFVLDSGYGLCRKTDEYQHERCKFQTQRGHLCTDSPKRPVRRVYGFFQETREDGTF